MTSRTRESTTRIATFAAAMGLILLLVVMASLAILSWATAFVLSVGPVAVRYLGRRLASERDAAWLPTLLPVAFLTKMLGAFANYYVTNQPSEGYRGGDAASYYRIGIDMAPQLRQFQWPDAQIENLGVRTVTQVTGILYSVTDMDAAGGFLLFASLSFLGLVLFYLAYRRSTTGDSSKMYFLGIFFLPSMVFWPSAIGKDALMTLALGITAFGVARLLSNQARTGLVLAAIGVASAYMIRPHIAVLVVGAATVGSLAALQRDSGRFALASSRSIVVATVGVVLVIVMPIALTQIGAGSDITEFAERVNRQTTVGGSSVEAVPVLSPTRVPLGIVSVIARPFPQEATSGSQLIASLEGLLLLLMVVGSLPGIVKGRSLFLKVPYLSFAAAFTLGFIIAFSTLSNLGLLARQRAMMLPFLLVAIAFFSPLANRLGVRKPRSVVER